MKNPESDMEVLLTVLVSWPEDAHSDAGEETLYPKVIVPWCNSENQDALLDAASKSKEFRHYGDCDVELIDWEVLSED